MKISCFRYFILPVLHICFFFSQFNSSASELEKLIDRKWILTEIQIGGIEKEDLTHRNFYIIFHYNFEMTYRLDTTHPGKIKVESMANNILQYKYLKSDEQTYNGIIGEKVYQCLLKAQRYSLRDDTLDIISEYGSLRFMALPYKDSGLTGTWILTGYTNAETEEAVKPPDKLKRALKIHFNDDGTNGIFDGNTEENEFSGKYEFSDTSRIFISKINIPKKIEKNIWNEKFWEVIKFTSLYLAKNDVLFLYFNDDKEYMEFQQEEEQQ